LWSRSPRCIELERDEIEAFMAKCGGRVLETADDHDLLAQYLPNLSPSSVFEDECAAWMQLDLE
jgi:hypothetical protein